MKFRVTLADAVLITEGDLEFIGELKKIGFEFEDFNEGSSVCCAVNLDDPIIEINTLEELMDFVKKCGTLIIDKEKIEIYNGYRN